MIVSIRNKSLRELFEEGQARGIKPQHRQRVKDQLLALDSAHEISDMDIPGFQLHRLLGDKKGRWSISVDKNWRITFEFRHGNAHLLDYEDYH